MTQDLHDNIKCSRALSPVSGAASDAAQVSEIIDTADFDSLEFVIALGSLADADATFTVLVEDGDASNLSDNAAVADAQLVGTEAGASFIFSDDNAVRKIGYLGSKRYVRMTITPANNTGAWLIAVVAIQGGARKAPIS